MPASPRQRSHLICSAPCPAMTAMPRGRPQTAAPPSTPAPLGLTAYFLCCCVTQDRDPAAADLERSRSRTVRPVRLHPPDGGRRGRRTRTPEVMGLLLRAGADPPAAQPGRCHAGIDGNNVVRQGPTDVFPRTTTFSAHPVWRTWKAAHPKLLPWAVRPCSSEAGR